MCLNYGNYVFFPLILYLIQVRVFIHSASGQVTEQDVSVSCPNNATPTDGDHVVPEGVDPPVEGAAQGEELVDPSMSHNHTTTQSEVMEMTCETAPRYDDEPYVEQVGTL